MKGTRRYRKTVEQFEIGAMPPALGTYTPPAPYKGSWSDLDVVRVISGGQTGVDRAALDWAISRGIRHGGYCPKGRRAEDGAIPAAYALEETASRDYSERTRRNILVADATLILNVGTLDGGTRLTLGICEQLNKPCRVVQLDGLLPDDLERMRKWIREIAPKVLNIAGPRQSKRPGIYASTIAFLDRLTMGDA